MAIIENAADLTPLMSKGQRLMGLDLGTKTIGMATADIDHKIATPFDTIRRKKFGLDVAALENVLMGENIGGLVMGLPLNMDGSESEMSAKARRFARRLEGRFGLPVSLQDERLSSREASERLPEKARNARHGEAARVILEDYLRATGS